MTLDRASIEKKDFPITKRGYDPAAVDSHLRALADAVEQLRRGGNPPTETLAAAVSEQVRRIVEAAEKSATDILADSEREALQIRARASDAAERARLEATGEAQREREEAAAQARNYVGRLSNSISHLLERLETMDGELNALTASLRMGTERLRGELESVEDELAGVITGASRGLGVEDQALGADAGEPAARDSALGDEGAQLGPAPAARDSALGDEGAQLGPAPAARDSAVGDEGAQPGPAPAEFFEPADEYPPEPAKVGDVPPEQSGVEGIESAIDEAATPVPGELAAVDETPGPGEAAAPPFPNETAVPPSDDSEGARLIALNMALNGTSREETDRYLAENFNLQDRERLLDEVYAIVQG